MRGNEPIYTKAEEIALETLGPIAFAIATACESIHDAAYQRGEAKYWRELHNETQMRSIRHGEAMMGNVLKALLDNTFSASKVTETTDTEVKS